MALLDQTNTIAEKLFNNFAPYKPT